MRSGGIGCRPIFHVSRDGARQFERRVMCLRRERDDEVEVQALVFLYLVEGARLVLGGVHAELLEHAHREGIELTLAYPGRLHVERLTEIVPGDRLRHRRTDGVLATDEQN